MRLPPPAMVGLPQLASIYSPMSVALDGAGNLYIAEFGGNRIRRVDHQTGVIATVAGTGSAGFGGDGGPATSAVLNHAAGTKFDSTGNLYFADMANYRVRRIDAQTGTITTAAGNGISVSAPDGVLAATAGMARPIWVAFDPSGGLLISESLWQPDPACRSVQRHSHHCGGKRQREVHRAWGAGHKCRNRRNRARPPWPRTETSSSPMAPDESGRSMLPRDGSPPWPETGPALTMWGVHRRVRLVWEVPDSHATARLPATMALPPVPLSMAPSPCY